MEGRIQPHSDEAERSVLGAALQSQQALYDVMETLQQSDFYHSANREIFDAMRTLYHRGDEADIITVAEILKKEKKLDAAGGEGYLGELMNSVPSPSSAAQYAKIVSEKAILRKLIEESGEIITKSYEDREEAIDVLDDAEKRILNIGQTRQGRDYTPISMALEKTLKRMEEMKDAPSGITGLSTGFADLDKKTSGLQNSDLIVLAARPGMGKTSFALNIALNAAKKSEATILIFSLEMPEIQLSQRLLSAEAMVGLERIRSGKAFNDTAERRRVEDARDILKETKIYIVDAVSGISIGEIKNKCRRVKSKEGLDLIIVDYLQLMHLTGGAGSELRPDSRAQEIAILTRMMKQLAGEMDCPLILLSQLSRNVEGRREPRPVLSDLRESGAIEQDADIVMFIYNENKDEEKDNGQRELLLEKHRNGETGKITLAWMGLYTKFASASSIAEEDLPF